VPCRALLVKQCFFFRLARSVSAAARCNSIQLPSFDLNLNNAARLQLSGVDERVAWSRQRGSRRQGLVLASLLTSLCASPFPCLPSAKLSTEGSSGEEHRHVMQGLATAIHTLEAKFDPSAQPSSAGASGQPAEQQQPSQQLQATGVATAQDPLDENRLYDALGIARPTPEVRLRDAETEPKAIASTFQSAHTHTHKRHTRADGQTRKLANGWQSRREALTCFDGSACCSLDPLDLSSFLPPLVALVPPSRCQSSFAHSLASFQRGPSQSLQHARQDGHQSAGSEKRRDDRECRGDADSQSVAHLSARRFASACAL
jgi:hypothetical protein